MGKSKDTRIKGFEGLSVLLPEEDRKKYEEEKKPKSSNVQLSKNSMLMANLGWLFYRDYYNGLCNGITREIKKKDRTLNVCVANCLKPQNDDEKQVISIFFKEKNDSIVDCGKLKNPNYSYPVGTHSFSLATTYPGLAIGTGVNHETGLLGECKLGFQFDHTTGLPIIPGSSVKGLLRSMFPYSAYSNRNDQKSNEYRNERLSFLRELCAEIKVGFEVTDGDIKKLEMVVFEGVDETNESISMYKRHIFYDAVVAGFDAKGGLLGLDYITPHKNPLRNPNPIQFLKVMPQVRFKCSFRLASIGLTNGTFTEDLQLKLFQQILLTVGVGAKTNVGYGQFENR